MGLTHPWPWEGCAWVGMDPGTQQTVFRDLYMYPHVLLSALLIYQHFSTFYPHPNVQPRLGLVGKLLTPGSRQDGQTFGFPALISMGGTNRFLEDLSPDFPRD